MRLTLNIQIGNEQPVVTERQGETLTIGRDPECDFVLPDIDTAGLASSRHAQFSLTGCGLVLTDLGTTNGTMLNCERVTTPQSVTVGDSIELGPGGPVVRIDGFSVGDEVMPPLVSRWLRIGIEVRIAIVAVLLVLPVVMWLIFGRENSSATSSDPVPPPIPVSVPVPPHPEPIELQTLTEQPLDSVTRAVGCLGFRFEGDLHGDETAWLVAPDKVITTALTAGTLQQLRDFDSSHNIEIVLTGLTDTPIVVTQIRLHRNYDFDNPGTPESLLHDVAVMTLEEPVSGLLACQLAPSDALSNVAVNTSFRAIGYENPTKQTELFDPVRIRRQELKVSIIGSELPSGQSIPVLKTSFTMTRGLSGAPVFDTQANVIGLLTQRKSRGFIVPVSEIHELLKWK